MKIKTWLTLATAAIACIGIIILPFLPGPPNRFVIGISALTQFAGFFGLVLVPLGVTWMIWQITQRNKKSYNWKVPYILAITATSLSTATFILFNVAMYFNFTSLTNIAVILTGIVIFYFVIKDLDKLRNRRTYQFNIAPLLLVVIPMTALMSRMFIVGPISAYSRELAIQKGEILISRIEDYKTRNGQYPEKIDESVSPNVMGILKFRYNKIGDNYSVSFSQWLDFGSLEEIVIYDKDNLHQLINNSAYDYSVDLHRVNGAFASYNTGYDNWRYYLAD